MSQITKLIIFFYLHSVILLPAVAQLDIQTAEQFPYTPRNIIENVFLGEGVEVLDVRFSGSPRAAGVFNNAQGVIGLERGIILTTGYADDAMLSSEAIANEDTSRDSLSDPDLEGLLVNDIDLIDMVLYEITFRPAADTLRFDYVFASDEYPDFVCSSTNDVFGFFIKGPRPGGGNYDFENIALVPDPQGEGYLDLPVSVNYVNAGMPGAFYNASPYCEEPLGSLDFSQYYNSTPPGNQPIYNAFLDVFTAQAPVIPCETYTIKLAIADGRLGDFDSAVFLAEKSFSTNSILIEPQWPGVEGLISEGCVPGIIEFSLPQPSSGSRTIEYRILEDIPGVETATEGDDYAPLPDSLVIPAGTSTIQLEIYALEDGIDEGTEYIMLEIKKDNCTNDTLSIPVRDSYLSGTVLPDSAVVCQDRLLQLPVLLNPALNNTEIPMFHNNGTYATSASDTVIQSSLEVTGMPPGPLRKDLIARICINELRHRRLNDLDIFLESPSGQLLELSTDNGARPNNDIQDDAFINTCFTVFSPRNINNGNPQEGEMDLSNPTYSGDYNPEGSFDNWLSPSAPSVNGNYTLIVVDEINDNYFAELNGWYIEFFPAYRFETSWFPETKVQCPGCDTVNIRPDISEYYRLDITDSNGCLFVDSVWIEAIQLPDLPEYICMEDGTPPLQIIPDSAADALIEIRVNGQFPWILLSDKPEFSASGLHFTAEPGNFLTIEGLLPGESLQIIYRVINEAGCTGMPDTIVCMGEPCASSPPEIENIIVHPECMDDGDLRIDILMADTGQYYTYSLDLGSNTKFNDTGIFYNVPVGKWPLRITNSEGCTTLDSVAIEIPPPLIITTGVDSIRCSGESSGRIEIIANGGLPPYSYSWTTGDVTHSINNLSPGEYGITVTDSRGCSIENQVELTDPPGLSASAIQLEQISCDGMNPGSATVHVYGGRPPYFTSWSNGQQGDTVNVAQPGLLLFDLYDLGGCHTNGSVEITQLEPFDISFSNVSTARCSTDSSMQATIVLDNGLPPYEISWVNGDTGETSTRLHTGYNVVRIKDGSGCTLTDSVFIQAPDPISIIADTIHSPDCAALANGAIGVEIFGGTAENGTYSILWSSGDTTPISTALAAGSYCITVTDDNGCEEIACFELSALPPLEISFNITPPHCPSDPGSSIVIFPSGGSGNYDYNWDGPPADYTNPLSISALQEGTYFLTLTDANNPDCYREYSFDITAPSGLEIHTDLIEMPQCSYSTNGVLSLVITGGTPPYTVNPTSGNIIGDSLLTGIPVGETGLLITDLNGCVLDTMVYMDGPVPIVLNSQVDSIYCEDDTGSITISALGGQGGFNYTWDNGDTTQVIDSLSAGIYSVTVTDSDGCVTEESFEIAPNSRSLNLVLSIKDVSCNNGSDGIITGRAVNGAEPYLYSINGSSYTSDSVFTSLTPGSYTISLIDGNGCTAESEAQVHQLEALIIDAGPDITVEYGESAELSAQVLNAEGPFDWLWETQPAVSVQCATCPQTTISDITISFTATVTAKDTQSCKGTDFINVTMIENETLLLPTAFSPNGDSRNDILYVLGHERILVRSFKIFDEVGRLVFENENFNPNEASNGWDGNLRDRPAPQGLYTWVIEYELPGGRTNFKSGQTMLLN